MDKGYGQIAHKMEMEMAYQIWKMLLLTKSHESSNEMPFVSWPI